ncbi:chloramphenicol-sensitive protein RarD [Litorimonas taeanensis]|uniref:Chloramphenicol-sensitive protein RarD n=1 Tax=Litorimonas taeanensis TaxID=568099 RepID=A0A420WKH4_9PROT|nr:EamA family transporter RarD [Litorimonas taeanensis]RKQ71494.1 chloramphenicol-sensitive protein RarD [Litorimonas taeanensis]
MKTITPLTSQTDLTRHGLWAGVAAYFIWGLFPFYFKATASISAVELVSHRVIWSVPFGLLIIIFRHQIGEVISALKKPKTIALLFLAAVALALNWGMYIWAIQQNQIFQGSLGYYINPIIYVLVGVVFMGETLSKAQGIATALAFFGVAVLTIYGGVFPGIALFLAITFTTYGVIRKKVEIGAMPGLFIETLLLLLPAIVYLLWVAQQGTLQFTHLGTKMDILILLAGPITVLPLLAFAFAARRLKLSTLGFLQFIGPTLQFLCGLYFGETFTLAHAVCFGSIWIGVAIFSYDAWQKNKKVKRLMKPIG